MDVRPTLVPLWIVAAFLIFGCEPAKPPRGLILISLDTLRADHLGTYGYERPTSPRLDAFAGDGIVFEEMLANAPNTPPSHMSLFTGLLPVQHGYMGFVNHERRDILAEEHRTLAEILQEQGFATGAFTGGGWMSGSLMRGFDVAEISADLKSTAPLEWLRKHPEERFFLFIHTYQIHAPYQAEPRYRDLFVDASYGGKFRPTPRVLKAVKEGRRKLRPAELRRSIDLYDAGIRQADAQVGDLLDALDKDGILDEAIVIITSDHGEEFLEHGSVGHWQIFYRPNLQVPLLLRLPRGEQGGRRITERAEIVDVMPTVLELLGVPAHDGVFGRSWGAAVRGGEPPIARPALAWPARPMEDPRRSVVADGYQLMVHTDEDRSELYDLATDPMAQRDVCGERPEDCARLRAHWDEWAPREKGAWAADSKPFSPLLRRSLEALGYLGGSDDPS